MKKIITLLLATALLAPLLPAAPKEKQAVPCVAIDYDKLDGEGPAMGGLFIWGKPSKFWDKTQYTALKVRFLDGSTAQRNKAWAKFAEVDRICGVNFIPVDSGNSHIRVSFRQQGHWSYLGKDCLNIPQNAPTMSLQLTSWSPDSEYNRVVVHETLHALGFEHEAQHPNGSIPWDFPKVVDYYARTQGWNAAQTRQQVLNRYTGTNWTGTAPDTTSIMHYPVEESLTIGKYSVPWNTKMSPSDASFLLKTYPHPKASSTRVSTGNLPDRSIQDVLR